MEIIFSILFSGLISFIVSVLVTEYQFRKKNKRKWNNKINSLIAEIKSNTSKDKKEICEKSNKWKMNCSELISNRPRNTSESIIKDLNDISDNCEFLSNMQPVSGGYNDEFDEKIRNIERASERIEKKIG